MRSWFCCRLLSLHINTPLSGFPILQRVLCCSTATLAGIARSLRDRQLYRFRSRTELKMHFDSESSPGCAIGRVADLIRTGLAAVLSNAGWPFPSPVASCLERRLKIRAGFDAKCSAKNAENLAKRVSWDGLVEHVASSVTRSRFGGRLETARHNSTYRMLQSALAMQA